MKNLEKIFNPKSVALIGATDKLGSVGLGICKNLLEGEEERKIFFVNPYRERVLIYFGKPPYKKRVLTRKTYPLIASIKEPLDLAIVAVPAKIVPKVIKECCEKKVGGIFVISSGFAEIGKEGKVLQDKITKMAKRANIPLVGPNCLGVIRPLIKLNASFAPATPRKGEIAFVSQSGALIDSVIDRSLVENYGFSALVSYGNEADLELPDFLEWLAKDEETNVIAIYLEAIKDGRSFIKVVKKVLKKKPIVVLKAGKTRMGAKAVTTHTAALAGSPEIYSAVFKEFGLFEVETIEELFDVAKALAWQPSCKNGIGIVTNGGGVGVLAADFCERMGVKLSKLNSRTLQKLENSKIMHPAFSRANPLDIVGDALSDRYKLAVETLLSQRDIRGLIIIQTLQIMTEVLENAKVIIEAKKKYPKKPLICCFMGGKLTAPAIKLLEKNKIPNYSDPKRATISMKALIE